MIIKFIDIVFALSDILFLRVNERVSFVFVFRDWHGLEIVIYFEK